LIPAWFQPAAAIVLLLAYALSLRARPGRALECLAIAFGAWAGEESCIRLYGFYSYSPDWWPFVSHVPLLIVAIWPMIVESARDVASELWPGASRLGHAGLVALVVTVDASLMEVVATANGLWSWAEPGYLGVPLIGILGWVFFATPLAFGLEGSRSRPLRTIAWSLGAVLATHALLIGAWWGGLRWVLRGDLGPLAIAGFAPLAVGLLVLVLRGGRGLRVSTMLARVAAASMFFALLARTRTMPLVAHVALVAVPYIVASARSVRSGTQAPPFADEKAGAT
jgi:hypothetical protein